MTSRNQTNNLLLSALPPNDFTLLGPHLERVELPIRTSLERPGKIIEAAYFIEVGLGSVVTKAGEDRDVEVGIVGSEGMTGLPLLLDGDRSVHQSFMQVGGSGWRIQSSQLIAALDDSSSLRKFFLRYANAFLVQVTFTALANGRYRVDERLARWLLMAQDRLHDASIPLTHEYLAVMLGVRRAGVTVALAKFDEAGYVKCRRGNILITDRDALIKLAGSCYGEPEAHYARLFTHHKVAQAREIAGKIHLNRLPNREIEGF